MEDYFVRNFLIKNFITLIAPGNVRIFIDFRLHILSSKHFNVVLKLWLGQYHVLMFDTVKPTLKQRCVHQRWKLQCWATSNQRYIFQWNVKITLSFSTLSFKTLNNVVATLWIWPTAKNKKQKSRLIKYLSAWNIHHFKLNTVNLKFDNYFKIAKQ